MATEFDFDAPDVPATAVADVAAEIKSSGKLPVLSDAEREQRRINNEIYLWECRQREEERAFEYQQRQAEAEAIARHEAALEIAENNRRTRLELQERQRERDRERQLVGLHIRAKQQEVWQSNVEAAARIAVHQRQRQTLMGELERMINPPQPQPEPTVVYVEAAEGSDQLGTSDFNPKLWMQKSRSWF